MSWLDVLLKVLKASGSAYKQALVKTMLEEFISKDVLCENCKKKIAEALDKWTERIAKKK